MNAKLCVSSLVVFLLAALAFPATAFAQDDFPLTISFGLKGGVNMQGGSEVPDLTADQRREFNLKVDRKQSEDSGIYGHFGAGPAVGGMLEVRILEMIGLEFGMYYGQDNSTGWEDKLINGVEQGRVSHDLEVNALHFPILFKANVKNDTIKPFVGVGVEIVSQQKADISYRSSNENNSPYPARFVEGIQYQDQNGQTIDQPGFDERIKAEPSTYVLLQLTFGMEVDLGDVRIPFEIRYGFNPGYGGDSFSERMGTEPRDDGFSNFLYDPAYMMQGGIYTGIAYDFSMNL